MRASGLRPQRQDNSCLNILTIGILTADDDINILIFRLRAGNLFKDFWISRDKRCLHLVEPETRSEQSERNQKQRKRFPNFAPRDKKPLGSSGKNQHPYCRNDKHRDPVHHSDIDQQKIVIEDKKERQDYGAQRIEKRRETGLDRIAARHSRRREGRQSHRWCYISHNTKIKHEHMDRDQRHDQPVRRAKLHDHTGH